MSTRLAHARARLYALARNLATASERLHNEGPTEANVDAMLNASSDLDESAVEFAAALAVAEGRRAA